MVTPLKICISLGLKELMEVYNELMLADKGYHALAAWQGEIIDQAIEVSYTELMKLMEVYNRANVG
jgi:hypothetical protein